MATHGGDFQLVIHASIEQNFPSSNEEFLSTRLPVYVQ